MNMSTAFAPATVANVSCGFDILGFALEEPGDIVSVEKGDVSGVTIRNISGDGGLLPYDSDKNVCSVAIQAMLNALGQSENLQISITKGLPLGSGLGSSAASTVAALVAANEVLGAAFTRRELLRFAIEGERIACGAAHADNVAPSLLGGIVLIRDYESLDVISLPVPDSLYVTIVHPHFELRTQDARMVLRKKISLEESRIQCGNVGGFIAGLYSNDYELIRRSLRDVIAEPSRGLLIPGFYELREAALAAGALGSGISGSGPSIFILSPSKEIADNSKQAAESLYATIGLGIDAFVVPISSEGARLINS
jgi:homoserine kinase